MDVVDRAMQGDPAIRCEVLQDLVDAPPGEVAAERQRVATEGWGARLLAEQTGDGRWDGGVHRPGWVDEERPFFDAWTATHFSLETLATSAPTRTRRPCDARSSSSATGSAGTRATSRQTSTARPSPASTARPSPRPQRDERCAEAVGLVRSRRRPDGRRAVEQYRMGPVLFEMEGEEEGFPSRWITLRAARVLRWWDRQTASSSQPTAPSSSVSTP